MHVVALIIVIKKEKRNYINLYVIKTNTKLKRQSNSMTLTLILIFTGAIFLLLIFNEFVNRRYYSYWKRLGIDSLPAIFPVGNAAQLVLQRTGLNGMMKEWHSNCKGRFVGVYVITGPVLVVKVSAIQLSYRSSYYLSSRTSTWSATFSSRTLRISPTAASTRTKSGNQRQPTCSACRDRNGATCERN